MTRNNKTQSACWIMYSAGFFFLYAHLIAYAIRFAFHRIGR